MQSISRRFLTRSRLTAFRCYQSKVPDAFNIMTSVENESGSNAPPPPRSPWLGRLLWGGAVTGVTGYFLYRHFAHQEQPVETMKRITEPAKQAFHQIGPSPPFLPAPPAGMDRFPFTLVLPLSDFLVHHTYQDGIWRVALRPGLEPFLIWCAANFELVVWSNGAPDRMMETLQRLDPNICFFSGALSQVHKTLRPGAKVDETSMLNVDNPQMVRDIQNLGRPMERIIFLESDADTLSLHPGNGLKVPAWTGDAKDRTLDAVTDILEDLVMRMPKDVRTVLSPLAKENDPIAAFYQQLQVRYEQIKAEDDRRLAPSLWRLSSASSQRRVPDTFEAYLSEMRRHRLRYVQSVRQQFVQFVKERQPVQQPTWFSLLFPAKKENEKKENEKTNKNATENSQKLMAS